MISSAINLTTTASSTVPISTGEHTRAAMQVVLRASQAWSTAVASLQWTITDVSDPDGTDLASWQAFSPAITFSTSTPARPLVSIPPQAKIRLVTTTAAGTADNAARFVLEFC